MVVGVDREVRVAVVVGAAARAVMLLVAELHAVALTTSTVATVATVTPCAARSTDRDHMSNRPFRAHPEGDAGRCVVVSLCVVVIHNTCRAVCAVKQDYRNVL